MFKNYIDNYLKDCEYCWNKNYLKTLYKLYKGMYDLIEEDEQRLNK